MDKLKAYIAALELAIRSLDSAFVSGNAAEVVTPCRPLADLWQLPPAERAAWRELFDHYVFGDEDPAAHIPEARRGWLGDLDAEQSMKLLERIRQYL